MTSRRPVLALGAAASLLAVAPTCKLLLWNTTASAPVGLYGLQKAGRLAVGTWVVVAPPPRVARDLAQRRLLPFGVPLLKRVAAVAPAQVCRFGAELRIDSAPVAVALARDRAGSSLPVWDGCVRLNARQVFLLNPDPRSFDGRYFGVTDRARITATARQIWIVGRR